MTHCRPLLLPAIVAGIAILFSAATTAGERKITKKELPLSVATAFEKAYPKAAIRGLSREEKDGKALFEIESIDGKTHRDILYDAEGDAIEIEETIPAAALPDAVKATAQREFPKGKILKAEKLTRRTAAEFELVISAGKARHELVVDPKGMLVKKEATGEKD